jgi:hypothetical protein
MASFKTAARADSAGMLSLILLMVVFGYGKKLETGQSNSFKSSLSKDEIDALVKHVHQLAKTK